jgi:hypothetical protein
MEIIIPSKVVDLNIYMTIVVIYNKKSNTFSDREHATQILAAGPEKPHYSSRCF